MQRRSKNAFGGTLPSLVYFNLVCQRSDQMKVFSLICGESFLHCQRIMRTSIIQFLKALEAMQRTRMVIAYSRLFRIAIGNALVTFHNGPDGSFPFSSQACEFCAGN